MSGYVFGKDIFGNTTCISADQYCRDKYGYGATYSYLKDACKCKDGYVWGTDFLGKEKCITGDQYCRDEYGYNSRYNSLTGKCECKSGYEMTKKKYGSGLECVSCSSKYGIGSTYNYLTDSCECMSGYIWGTDLFGDKTCISGDQYCRDKYGHNSKYNSLTDKCECGSGYEMTRKKYGNGFECISCFSKYGLHSSYNYLTKKCECDSDYILSDDGKCVRKENNVYFILKEVDTGERKAIIQSEYDYRTYLITYGYGCYSSSISRYLNDRIVVNLGTDFDVDIWDKIVLYDDNEVCDILSVEQVDSDFTLEPEEESVSVIIPQIYSGGSIFIPEGALIRAKSGIDVYIVKYLGSKKFKRLILSPSVFNNYSHLKWEDVIDIEQSVVDSFTTSELVRAVGDDKVYKLYPMGDTGEKRWIKTGEAFARMSFDWDAIYEINQFDRDSYITGAPIE